ncbi:MAG: hypothetical protein AB7U85_05395 [Alphaproteobacteria bacterium]
MNSSLIKTSYTLAFAASLMVSASAIADSLPVNPWATQQAVTVQEQSTVTTKSGLPSDPWRGSGNSINGVNSNTDARITNYRPQYTGQSTTWNTAMGQDAIAPEVNINNMLVMTNHLRSLGYNIPPSFDNFIKTAPAKLRKKIMKALKEVKKGGSDPLSNVLATVIQDAEDSSGMTTENILGTSLNLISK